MQRKNVVIYIFLIAFFVMIITNTDKTILSVRDTLLLISQTVIPSLFPFFVLSSLMINTGFVSALGGFISPVAKLLFKTSGNGAVVFAIGILCGYPTGAKMTSELYRKNMITKEEAETLLPYCNNSGPLFIIGAVGNMLGNTYLGIKLYIIHIISAFLTGIIFSFASKDGNVENKQTIYSLNIGKAISDSVITGTQTMLNVCGFIIFFAVFNTLLTEPLLNITGKNTFGIFLSGLTEVTLGAKNIIVSGIDIETTFVLLSGILGFGGICVFLQVMGIISGVELSSKKYLIGKIIQMTISMILAKIYLFCFETQPVFLSAAEITKRYKDSSPVILISFFLALIYFAARKN